LLNKQNVHYQVSEVPVNENERALWHDQHLRTMSAAKSVILQDGKGRVQVIFAADRLLDLKAVNRQLSRELHAAKPEDVHKFCVSHNLQSIPALPKLAGLLTLIDRSLVERSELLADSGDEKQLLRFSRAA
jgi:prolyl-tRNA editing enzyme YbaK/EbsC (Cys-tRNA(Pro) deacylase)